MSLKKNKKVLIMGCGNMTSCLLNDLNLKTFKGYDFYCFTPSKTKAEKLAHDLGVHFLSSLDEINSVDVLFLGHKPQQLNEVVGSLENKYNEDVLVVSILAGVKLEKLSELFNTKNVLRVMPNIPSKVSLGVNMIVNTKEEKDPFVALFNEHLKKRGRVLELDNEEELDLLTPIIGSAPAYVYKFMEMFELALKKVNNTLDASNIVSDLFFGAVELYKNENKSFQDLRESVTSKKGVTEEVLKSLDKKNFAEIFANAIVSGQKRNKELGEDNE